MMHYGVIAHKDEPIRGVVLTSRPEFLHEDEADGIDLSWLEHLSVCEKDDHSECMYGESDVLIGFIETTDGVFEIDVEAEYSAFVRSPYTQVLRSKHAKRCALCSPCFQGQGDLDSDGEYLTYDLPPEVWGKQSPQKGDGKQ